MRFLATVLSGVALAGSVLARAPGFGEYRAVQESLGRMPAKFHAGWLQRHGLDASRYTEYRRPETTGLLLRGKWGRGTSNEVTGRGNLVALTLGSEVALLNVANPDSPVVLSEIQLSFIPAQSALHDSFLLTGGNGIEIWSIADSTQPVFRNVITYAVNDFAIYDTLLYFASRGTFHSYSIANAANPYELGTCTDSGDVMTATRNVAVAEDTSGMLWFMDVSDPAAPRRVGSYPTPYWAWSAAARGNICVASMYWFSSGDQFRLEVLDISDPANVVRIGSVDGVGGFDAHLSGPVVFVSGYQWPQWEFTMVDIQDSVHPQVISSCATPGGNFGVWADWASNWAYVADVIGLAVINTSDINSPVYDTTVLVAHEARDVWVDQEHAYVADCEAGLRILGVANPAAPVELGGIDTAFYHYTESSTAVGRDSFAFAGWMPAPPLRSIDITDPAHPKMAGGGAAQTIPQDMVLRDTFVYLAGRKRLNVVNVARPREPTLVGSCVLGGEGTSGLSLVDTLALAAAYPFAIINVKDPTNPVVVGTISRGARNGSVRDTFLFLSSGGVVVYSIADPTQPRLLDSISLGPNTNWVEAVDTLLYTGNTDGVHVVDASDVHNMRELTFSPTPATVTRLTYASPHIYAACWAAGICIFDTLTTGISELRPMTPTGCRIRVLSSITKDIALIEFSESGGKEVHLQLFDIAGNRLGRADVPTRGSSTTCYQLDLTGKPSGVYIVRVNVGERAYHLRITKLQ